MLILLSPAKTLDFVTPVVESGSEPLFARQARALAHAAAALSPRQLAGLMHISPKLAALNAERFAGFDEAPERPAIRAFAGDVYRGFDAATAGPVTIAFAQQHLRILSGLYGLLRPLDNIRPHRLEMGTRWAPKSDRLLDHWGARIGRALAEELRDEGSGVLVNLASNEYFAAVGPHLSSRVRIITPQFRIVTPAGLRFHSFAAKVARGAMARFLCENRISEPSALGDFTADGWKYEAGGSSPDSPLFLRY